MTKNILIIISFFITFKDINAQCITGWCNSPPFGYLTLPSGKALHDMYYSTIHNKNIGFRIFLPQSYDTSPDKIYPVIYFLPGGGSTELNSLRLIDYANAMKDEKIKEMVIITPNGFGTGYWHDYAYNPVVSEPVQMYTSFFEEMIPFLESKYRISNKKGSRGLIGFSAGGYGSLNFAISSNKFRMVISIDGALFAPGNETEAFKSSFNYQSDSIYKYNIFNVMNRKASTANNMAVLIMYSNFGFEDQKLFLSLLSRSNLFSKEVHLSDIPHDYVSFITAGSDSIFNFINDYMLSHNDTSTFIENTNKKSIHKFYPNPNTGVFYYINSNNDHIRLTLYNILGQEIYRKTTTDYNVLISQPNIAAGYYILNVHGLNINKNIMVTVQK